MTHEEIIDLLDAYIDGELDALARNEVEAHLEACEACCAEAAGLTALVSAARELATEIRPDRDLWPSIDRRIRDLDAHEALRAQLDDYVDGLLEPSETARVQRHLDSCEACRKEAASIRTLAARAGELAAEIRPDRDLWHAIRRRIAGPGVLCADFGAGAERRIRIRRGWLAAAAVLVAAVSSLTTVALMNRPSTPPQSASTRELPAPAPARVSAVEHVYQGAIIELMTELRRRRGHMSPATRAVIEENLEAIDAAIRSSRAALGSDPSDPRPLETMQVMYQKKMELLQRALKSARTS